MISSRFGRSTSSSTHTSNQAREAAFRISDLAAQAKAERKQLVLAQAFFLLCWGQIESEIDETSRRAIRKRQARSQWAHRRGWDIYNPDDKRLSGLSFDERLSLVLERQSGLWSLAMRHYNARNLVAHGRLTTTSIDLTTVIADLYAIQSALRD